MAQGTVTVFDEAKVYLADGTHDLDDSASASGYYCAIIDDGTTPSAESVSPQLGDFDQVTTAGTYTAGGVHLGTVTWDQTSGTATFDSPVNKSWTQDGDNATDARWGLIYRLGTHNSVVAPALAYVDLGGDVDMTQGDLTITWNDLGIFTLGSS